MEIRGLIAGAGRYPLELLRAARARNLTVAVVALERVAVAAVAQEADMAVWLPVGRLEAAARYLRGCGATTAFLAGGVPWRPCTVRPRPDRHALRLLGDALSGDDRLLRSLAATLAKLGVEIVDPGNLLDGMLARPGLLGGPPLDPSLRDLANRAYRAAEQRGRSDSGQAVIAAGDRLLVETLSGTDGLIQRAAESGDFRGGVLAKTAKPGQDRRFDLPALGPTTIRAAARVGLSAIVVQAGATLVVDKLETLSAADELGIALLALPECDH